MSWSFSRPTVVKFLECLTELHVEDGVEFCIKPLVVLTVEEFLECLSELYVEDGVDDRVKEAVDIAEPHKEAKEHCVNVTLRAVMQFIANTQSVDKMQSEEWHPTEEKNTCK